jgi:hypothetical protein
MAYVILKMDDGHHPVLARVEDRTRKGPHRELTCRPERRCLRHADEAETVEDIVSAMLELHPDRDNRRVVWHCAREAVTKRQQA